MTEQRIHLKTGLLLASVMIMLGMVIGGLVLISAEMIDSQLTMVLVLTGVGIGMFGIVSIPFRLTRHRWTLLAAGLEVRRGPWLMPRAWHSRAVVPYSEVIAIDRQYDNAREGTRITLRGGGLLWLQIPLVGGLSRSLQARVAQAQGQPLRPGEAAGFWASWAGLAVLVLALGLSLIIAGTVVFMLWESALDSSTSGRKGAAIGLFLPFGIGYAILAAWRRRRVTRGTRQRWTD